MITGHTTIPWEVTGPFDYDLEVSENSFVIDTAGNGMSVQISGSGDCSSLASSGTVTWNHTTSALTIVPTTGVFLGCRLSIVDFGGNSSNAIVLDDFVYGM